GNPGRLFAGGPQVEGRTGALPALPCLLPSPGAADDGERQADPAGTLCRIRAFAAVAAGKAPAPVDRGGRDRRPAAPRLAHRQPPAALQPRTRRRRLPRRHDRPLRPTRLPATVSP